MNSHTVAAQNFTHRYEVSSRQRSILIGEDVIDFYVKLKEDEHMLSPELKKLLNDLQAGESNIRIDREKIQAELEALDNVPVFLKHSLSMSTRVCPTCGRKL